MNLKYLWCALSVALAVIAEEIMRRFDCGR